MDYIEIGRYLKIGFGIFMFFLIIYLIYLAGWLRGKENEKKFRDITEATIRDVSFKQGQASVKEKKIQNYGYE